MLIDWKSFLPAVRGSVMVLAEASPETVGAYRQVCAAGTKEAHLDAKTRELISLAVAVTTRSDGCIAAHTKAAIDFGATREEVAEALSVAIARTPAPRSAIPPASWTPSRSFQARTDRQRRRQRTLKRRIRASDTSPRHDLPVCSRAPSKAARRRARRAGPGPDRLLRSSSRRPRSAGSFRHGG